MYRCVPAEHLQQAPGIAGPARARHSDCELSLHGCVPLSCDTNVGFMTKRVYAGIRPPAPLLPGFGWGEEAVPDLGLLDLPGMGWVEVAARLDDQGVEDVVEAERVVFLVLV